MEYRRLGRSDIEVSIICLGSMTWGEQNSEAEGFEQMDYALDRGINFIDTAEMYAAPPSRETCGRTEEIIGKWLAARGGRDRIVLATKATGPSDGLDYIRGEPTRLDRRQIAQAIDGSLRPAACGASKPTTWTSTSSIGRTGRSRPSGSWATSTARARRLRSRKPWARSPSWSAPARCEQSACRTRRRGASCASSPMRFLALAEAGRGPRMVSIQNPYSLLNRSFETGLAEVALREDCGLLAYAPVAAGALTGKYLGGQRPEGARMTLFPNNKRYFGEQGQAATAAYVALVENSIAAKDLVLSEEVLNAIESLHKIYTYPCP
jgi:aryl-alcohol dehydrogenase-like predicted oxidoreductase